MHRHNNKIKKRKLQDAKDNKYSSISRNASSRRYARTVREHKQQKGRQQLLTPAIDDARASATSRTPATAWT